MSHADGDEEDLDSDEAREALERFESYQKNRAAQQAKGGAKSKPAKTEGGQGGGGGKGGGGTGGGGTGEGQGEAKGEACKGEAKAARLLSWAEMLEAGVVAPGAGVLSVMVGKQCLAQADLLEDGATYAHSLRPRPRPPPALVHTITLTHTHTHTHTLSLTLTLSLTRTLTLALTLALALALA